MSLINSSTDIRTLAANFVQADRASQDQYFASRKSIYQSRISAYDSVSSKIQALQTTLSELSKSKQFESYKVTQSAEGYATINATSNAVAGQYQLHIKQLATAHQVALDFASEDAPLPVSGILSLSLGSDNFSVDMAELGPDATLADLRDAINNASDNPGIRATLVRAGGAVKLLIASEKTGQDNTLSLSTDGSPAMASLQTAIDNRTELSQAQDAIMYLGANQELELKSASNTFENVIDGLSITLNKTHQPGETLTFSVGQDPTATQDQLKKLVDGYNAIIDVIKNQGSGTSGALSGDSTLRSIQSQLRNQLSAFGISQIGLEFDRNGRLTLNSNKLTKFLETDPDGLTAMLGGNDGLIKSLNGRLDSFIKGNDAMINSAKRSVQSSLDLLQDRMTRFDERMETLYNRYLAQFSQMQSLIAQMEQTFNLF